MPSPTRRSFLIMAGIVGAAAIVARIRAGTYLKDPATDPHQTLETSMPSSSLIFVSGYAPANQPGIHAFLFNEITGALTSHGSFTGILNPSFIIVHPNRKWLYAVSETGQESDGMQGSVCALSFESEPFSAQLLNQQSSRGDWPCHLRFDTTGKWLITTNYGTGNAAVYPIQADGSLGEMTDFVQHQGKGPNEERQEGPHAHSSIFSPDNRFMIVADLGIDQLVIYQFDASAGKLLPHSSVKAKPGSGPRHLAFHPNGHLLYVANELDSSVTLYKYDANNGTLTEKQNIPTLPSAAPGNIVADIHLDESAKRLYVSNRGHNSIAVYDISDDGGLTLVSIPSCGGNWPRNFALAPSGKFMLVANQYSNEVCVMPLIPDKEAIGDTVTRVTVAGASCVQFL